MYVIPYNYGIGGRNEVAHSEGTKNMNISEFITLKMKQQDAIMQAMSADELDEFSKKLFAESKRLQSSGLKDNNADELKLAGKYSNAGSWANQVWAQKRFA